MRLRRPVTGLLAAALSGCAYYNGMWSAERLAHEARRQEASGQMTEARVTWERAAEKAESVLVHHPHSRWADDALVLQAEGLARSGACGAAAEPLRRALATVSDDALRERAALVGAECLLAHDGAGEVDGLLAPVLASRDRHRRSRAAYLAGEAALARGNGLLAARRFAESAEPAARPGRLRALIQAGRPWEAVALIDSVARHTRDEGEWSRVLEELGRRDGPKAAAAALDSLLRYGRLSMGARARLLVADGDRLRAARLLDRAADRYRAAAALVPDSTEGGQARLRLELVRAAHVADVEGLDSLASRLEVLTREPTGRGQSEARSWHRVVETIRRGDSTEITAFRAAELARDTLDAPALAASLFLRFAGRYPASLFAPKALIAAGQLGATTRDSLDRVLRTRYAASPYTLAYRGASSPAFRAVEESLAIAFGMVDSDALPTAAASRFAAPHPGPRGPMLDPLRTHERQRAGTAQPRQARPDVPTEKRPRQPADTSRDRRPDRSATPRRDLL